MVQTGDTELVRAINRHHVLDAIRRFEPVSRAEVGERTRLGRTTVSAIVADLLADGVIRCDDQENAVAAQRGRPRDALRINPNAAYVVGAKVSMHQVCITATNLRADALASLVVPVRTWRLGAEAVADLMEDGIRQVVVKAGLDLGQIAGAGIGIPGFIDAVGGISHWSPVLGDVPVPFARMLSQRLGLSVVIENDANLVALAERWFGHGQDTDNFVVVTVEGGIGMGMFIQGELFSGHHGMGTEFGHLKIDRHGPACRCGQFGCIEAFAADFAILRAARKLIDLPVIEDEASIEQAVVEITHRARAGHPGLLRMFREIGEILGLGIANLISVLDPGKVIVTGAGMRAADLIEPALRAAVSANSLSVLRGRCAIILHDWTDEVWARGAAALVLQGLYRVPWSRSTRIEMAG